MGFFLFIQVGTLFLLGLAFYFFLKANRNGKFLNFFAYLIYLVSTLFLIPVLTLLLSLLAGTYICRDVPSGEECGGPGMGVVMVFTWPLSFLFWLILAVVTFVRTKKLKKQPIR